MIIQFSTWLLLYTGSNLVEWLTAIGTVGAVTVSLILWFYSQRKAVFSIDIDSLYSFDFYQTMEGMTNREQYAYYTSAGIHLVISHVGGGVSDGVEILLNQIWKIDGDSRERYKYFYPTNLFWDGNRNGSQLKTSFVPGIIRVCRLGTYAMNDGYSGSPWTFSINSFGSADNSIEYKYSNELVEEGIYELELLVTGGNAKPKIEYFRLEFDGHGADNENELFGRHLKITKI